MLSRGVASGCLAGTRLKYQIPNTENHCYHLFALHTKILIRPTIVD